MRAHRASTMCLAFLLAGALSASCQDRPHAGERYVFVASNINLPYWQEAQAGFKDAARTMGVEVDFLGPTTYSPEEELKTFQNAVETHPTGILIAPARALLFKDMIDSAVQAGIPVVCVDSDSPESRRILFIGTDNFRAGVESGNRMATLLHGRGRVALITILAQLNLNDRLRGVQETLKRHPEIEIAEVIDDKGDAKQAAAQVSSLLEARKIDGILCLEASGGSGAAETLQRLNLSGKVPIVAMDKNPETLDWIKKGVISATIAQKPYTMSYYGLRFLDDLHHNLVHEFKDWRTAPISPLPALVDTGTGVVDKQNVEDFVLALGTKGKSP
jgi:ribose transport system substrate-binding protein